MWFTPAYSPALRVPLLVFPLSSAFSLGYRYPYRYHHSFWFSHLQVYPVPSLVLHPTCLRSEYGTRALSLYLPRQVAGSGHRTVPTIWVKCYTSALDLLRRSVPSKIVRENSSSKASLRTSNSLLLFVDDETAAKGSKGFWRCFLVLMVLGKRSILHTLYPAFERGKYQEILDKV